MNLEQLLNEALNEAICNTNRIKNPNTNKVAQFVIEFMERKELKFDLLNRVSERIEVDPNKVIISTPIMKDDDFQDVK